MAFVQLRQRHHRRHRAHHIALAAGTLAASLALTDCASFNKKGEGAAIGAGVGGVAGGIVGKYTGSTARGAIIGAVVGGATGMVIGSRMDEQARLLRQEVPGATVTRIGEGIQVTFASHLLYDVDSDVILSTAATNLRALAGSLDRFPGTDVLIVGHTDATGATAHNQALSERRATAASSYLASQGVATSRLQTAGRGELEPIESNDTESGRSSNRRVEIVIVANAETRKTAGQ
jgi:outer membrane protein OmpA-like peptidoglycan-associated protein